MTSFEGTCKPNFNFICQVENAFREKVRSSEMLCGWFSDKMDNIGIQWYLVQSEEMFIDATIASFTLSVELKQSVHRWQKRHIAIQTKLFSNIWFVLFLKTSYEDYTPPKYHVSQWEANISYSPMWHPGN